jgi:hypothetical protein
MIDQVLELSQERGVVCLIVEHAAKEEDRYLKFSFLPFSRFTLQRHLVVFQQQT